MRVPPRFLPTVLALCSLVGCYRSHERDLEVGPDAAPSTDAGSDAHVRVDAGPVLECYPTAPVLEFRGECVGLEIAGGDEHECRPSGTVDESLPPGRAVVIMNTTDADARLTFFIRGADECLPGPVCWAFMGSRDGDDPCSCAPFLYADSLPTASHSVRTRLPAGQIRALLLSNPSARYHVGACPVSRD